MDKYWVGGTGNWSDTNHWSTTDGGAGGAGVPASTDFVLFTSNSFSADNQIVTINAAAACSGIDEGVVSGNHQIRPVTLQFDSSANLTVTETVTTSELSLAKFEILSSATSSIICAGTGSSTVISLEPLFNGVHSLTTQHQINIIINGDTYYFPNTGATDSWFENLTVNNGGLLIFQNAINFMNNVSVASGGEIDFNSSSSFITILNWSASPTATITDNSSCGITLDIGTDANNTTYATATFAGGGHSYPNLDLIATTTTVTGNNTACQFIIEQGTTVIFPAGGTQTSSTWTTFPAPGSLAIFQSSSPGTQYTLSSSVNQNINNTQVSDMIGGGSGTWTFDSTSINGGNNTNLIFPSSGGSFLLNFMM